MTTDISHTDAYQRSTEATIESATRLDDGAWEVVLERTVFYPGGGGQPSDAGWLIRGDGERLER